MYRPFASRDTIAPNGVVTLILFTLSLLFGAQTDAREISDEVGRMVTLPDVPERIVSLAPSITEIVFALNLEDALVGVTQFSDFPPQASRLPSVGSYINLDLEKIVSLNPDLCIATKDGNPKAVISRLEALNIPVYVVDPRNLDGVMESILKIGEILDARQKAADIVKGMRRRIRHITSRVSGASHRPTVFFQIGITPIISVGSATFINELIVLAGGENVAKGPTPYPRFSQEQVVALAPEVLIITSMARGGRFKEVKKSWEKWSDLPAVKNHRILVVNSNLFDRAGPRLVDALETLAAKIHPEQFKGSP